MSLQGKRLLIAGGTGFIGRNLVEWFRAQGGGAITATYFSRKPPEMESVRWVKCDLRNPEEVRKILEGQDILIQAAATTSGVKDILFSPALHVTDNAVMNSYLFRQAVEMGLQHVVFFSCSVMYPAFSSGLVKETDGTGFDLHERYFGVGWTKLYCEKLCEFYAKNSSTKFTALRHSNIFGPFDKYDLEKSHMFGASVTKVLNADKEVMIWGNGEEERDLLYVDDLMGAVEGALLKQPSPFGLYNIGGGQGYTVNTVVRKIIAGAGKNLALNHDTSKPSIKTRIVLDCEKARKELGWCPQTSLDEGIVKTLAWIKKGAS